MRRVYGMLGDGGVAGRVTTRASAVCLKVTEAGVGPSRVTRSTLAQVVERDLMLAAPAVGYR